MWKFLIPIAAFIALAALFAMSLNPNRDIRALPSPLIGKPAPQFTLSEVIDAQKNFSNSALAGQVYLFNVWGTWCVGCRQEHETLLMISRQHVVPLIGLDWRDERARATEWLQELGNPYQTVAFDPEGRTAIDWGVYGAPETFLVDQNGRVLFKHIAPMTMQVWNDEFLPRIAKARGQGS